jgi:hypothetical protein
LRHWQPYVRNNWGNTAPTVSASDVQSLR